MNTNQLEYLIATLKYGGFREASTHLYVSPQALSKSISRLEQELGIKLFEKSGRGIKPTASAIVLSELSQDIVESLKSLKDMVLASARVGNSQFALGIISTPYHGGILLDKEISLIAETKLELGLRAFRYSNDSCVEALREGLIDAAIIVDRLEDDGFKNYKLASLPLGFAMSDSNPLANRHHITLDDIDKVPIAQPVSIKHVYRKLRTRLEGTNCHPQIVPVSPFLESYISFMQEGGIMLVHENSPLLQTTSNIVFRRDDAGLIPEVQYYFVYNELNKSQSRSIILNELRKIMKSRTPKSNI